MKSGWLTHGKYTELFEKEFSKFVNSRFAVTEAAYSGFTSFMFSIEYKKGDEVILPAMSHTATSHAIEYTGAKPIFVDVERISGNIDVNLIEKNYKKN